MTVIKFTPEEIALSCFTFPVRETGYFITVRPDKEIDFIYVWEKDKTGDFNLGDLITVKNICTAWIIAKEGTK